MAWPLALFVVILWVFPVSSRRTGNLQQRRVRSRLHAPPHSLSVLGVVETVSEKPLYFGRLRPVLPVISGPETAERAVVSGLSQTRLCCADSGTRSLVSMASATTAQRVPSCLGAASVRTSLVEMFPVPPGDFPVLSSREFRRKFL